MGAFDIKWYNAFIINQGVRMGEWTGDKTVNEKIKELKIIIKT